jgi:hypothetical protein
VQLIVHSNGDASIASFDDCKKALRMTGHIGMRTALGTYDALTAFNGES